MFFPHRLKYRGGYKMCILPIVQKTAGKKNVTSFQKTKNKILIFLLSKFAKNKILVFFCFQSLQKIKFMIF